MQRDDKGGYTNMADLYTTGMPCIKKYIRITPEFFEMLKENLDPRLTKRGSFCVGRGDCHHPQIPGQWGELHITPLPLQSWQGTKFMDEYLKCLTTPKEWKELETEFRQRMPPMQLEPWMGGM